MAVATRFIGSALAAVVGREHISEDPETLTDEAVDGFAPRWVLRPTALEELAGALALAHEEGLAVAVRGSGSALDLGHPPARLDIVIDTRGLNRVLDDQPDDLTISVEAGLSAGALAGLLNSRLQWLPIDPPGWATRTLGGLVATDASGPLRVRYGTLRDLLLGVRFVQPDGVVTWGGARVVKSVSGYDVPKLMVGALGTLGVLGELTFRLHPMPEYEGTWMATFPSAAAAQECLALILDSPLQPNRVEFLNGPALRASSAPDAPAGLAVSIGSVEAAVLDQGERFLAFVARTGGRETVVPDDFWVRYDRTLTTGEGEVVVRVASLASRLADTVHVIESELGRLGGDTVAIVTGCAALGVLRIMLTGAENARVVGLIECLRTFIADIGGSVVVAAGSRSLRTRVDPWGSVEPGVLALMRDVKETFDPKRVLNPGRFVGGL